MDIHRVENTAFADLYYVGRNLIGQVAGNIQRNLKSAQIPIVYADNFGAGLNRLIKFSPVMDLDQRRHSKIGGQFPKSLQLCFVQNRRDEQNSIRAFRGCLEHVIFVNRKILAQNGQRTGSPGSMKIRHRAMEEIVICQHRQRYGSAPLEFHCESCRVKAFDENSPAWGCFLDFGYYSRPPGTQGACEVTPLPAAGGLRQFGRTQDGFVAQLFVLAGNDTAQDIRDLGGQTSSYPNKSASSSKRLTTV